MTRFWLGLGLGWDVTGLTSNMTPDMMGSMLGHLQTYITLLLEKLKVNTLFVASLKLVILTRRTNVIPI